MTLADAAISSLISLILLAVVPPMSQHGHHVRNTGSHHCYGRGGNDVDPSAAPQSLFRLAVVKSGWRAAINPAGGGANKFWWRRIRRRQINYTKLPIGGLHNKTNE